MKCIELLSDEHHWIQHMLDCLEKIVANAGESGRLDASLTAELLYLLEFFADGLHQHKEQEVLFPAIIDRTTASEQDYLRDLLGEHIQECSQMERVRAQLAAALSGEPLGLRNFMTEAAEYGAFHRRHMEQENDVLLPIVARTLTPEEDERVLDGFRMLEASGPDSSGVHERVRALCKRLGVALCAGDG